MIDVGPFKRNGYQVIKGVIAPDVIKSIRSYLEGELGKSFEIMKKFDVPDDIADAGAAINKVFETENVQNFSQEEIHALTGHFPLEVRLSEVNWGIPRQPEVQEIIRSCLGSEMIFMHMPPTARFILPGNECAGVPPHQDTSYNTHMTDFIVVWTPLVPVEGKCGGVRVFEGSQNTPSLLDDYALDPWLKAVPTDGYAPVDCHPMEPGDILLLNKHIIHSSIANTSDRVRFSVDCRFFGEHEKSGKHFLDLQRWKVVDPT